LDCVSILENYRKGITLIFVDLDTEIDPRLTVGIKRGNANKLGNTNGSPGKSSLFLLRDGHPGIGSAGDRVVVPAKRHGSCGVRCTFVGP
jgi:hypothetical protein